MIYDNLLSEYSSHDNSESTILLSVETNLSESAGKLNSILAGENSEIHRNETSGNKNIFTMKVEDMTAVEFQLYVLGKRLASDMKNVHFRSHCTNRNTKALIRGISEINKDAVQILSKSNAKVFDGISNNVRTIDREWYAINETEIAYLRNIRSFKYQEVANKMYNLCRDKNILEATTWLKKYVFEASLFTGARFWLPVNAALFIEDSISQNFDTGVSASGQNVNCFLRALALDNKIPFKIFRLEALIEASA